MTAEATSNDWLLSEDQQKALLEFLEDFKNTVSVHLFVKTGENDAYADFSRKLVKDLARLNDKIIVEEHTDDVQAQEKYQVERFPTLLIAPDMYSIRFTGAPAGEEGQAFLFGLLMASTGNSHLTAESKKILEELHEKRDVKVFVSPTCPYCPGQTINAIKAAIEKPDLVSMECIESGEHGQYADTYSVGSVPHTVYHETLNTVGLESEQSFVRQLVALKPIRELEPQQPDAQDQKTVHYDLVIIGAGPAGLTAGIYARRAGLTTVILEKSIIGGQVSVTPEVENYPGFVNIGGKMLMDMVYEQAKQYVDVLTGQNVQEVKVGKNLEVITENQVYACQAVIYAAGADRRKLGVPGEERFMSKGVSFCASCDGYMFKDKKVAVVGGGNTALTDALHLHNLGVEVVLIHRRDSFRAEQHLVDSINREGIAVRWNSAVEEIGGDEVLEFVLVRDVVSGQTEKVKVDGVFMAVGMIPNVEAVASLGLAQEPGGYLHVDRQGRTSIPRVYAAGDITGGVQQIVTAVSEGASAAMAVFEDLTRHKTASGK